METELEIRGRFANKDSFEQFLDKIRESIGLGEHRSRLSVIFTSKNESDQDLQIRLHNLSTQVVLKSGKHSGIQRGESLLSLSLEDFLPAVDLFYRLGFTKGVVADCEDWTFILDKTELKITTCDNKIYCWEIESLDRKVGRLELEEVARSLGLVPLEEGELKEYWTWMQTCANNPFRLQTISKFYQSYVRRNNKHR